MTATLVPMLLIVILNSVLLKYACRRNPARAARSSLNTKAPLTVLCLSGLFLLSSLPYIVYTILTAMYGLEPRLDWLKSLSGFVFFLNLFGNPFVYTLTNARFYRHCRHLVLCWVSRDTQTRTVSSSSLTRKDQRRVPLRRRKHRCWCAAKGRPERDVTAAISCVTDLSFSVRMSELRSVGEARLEAYGLS